MATNGPKDTRIAVTVALPNGTSYDFLVEGPSFTVGRRHGCDLELPSGTVSAVHARFEIRPDSGTVVVTDLGSRNGTHYRNILIPPHHSAELQLGTPISIADSTLTVRSIPHTDTSDSLRSMDQSRSLSRVLMCGMLGIVADQKRARLEVLKGPARGRNLVIDTGRGEVRLGTGQDRDFDLEEPALDDHPLVIRLAGQRYVVEPHPLLAVKLGRHSVANPRPLRSGDRIRCGRTVIRFVDPLQKAVDRLNATDSEQARLQREANETMAPTSRPPGDSSAVGGVSGRQTPQARAPNEGFRLTGEPRREPSAGKRRPWQPAEVVLLVFGILAVATGLALIAFLLCGGA